MWPSFFGGFLRGGALCSPSREVGEVGPLCPALGLRSDAAALARISRRLSRLLVAAWAAAAHGTMAMPCVCPRRCWIWITIFAGPGGWWDQGSWEGLLPREQRESGVCSHPPAARAPPRPPSKSPAILCSGYGVGPLPHSQGPWEREPEWQQSKICQTISIYQGFFCRTYWCGQSSADQGGRQTCGYGCEWQDSAHRVAVLRLPLSTSQSAEGRLQELWGGEPARQGADQLRALQGETRAPYRVYGNQSQSTTSFPVLSLSQGRPGQAQDPSSNPAQVRANSSKGPTSAAQARIPLSTPSQGLRPCCERERSDSEAWRACFCITCSEHWACCQPAATAWRSGRLDPAGRSRRRGGGRAAPPPLRPILLVCSSRQALGQAGRGGSHQIQEPLQHQNSGPFGTSTATYLGTVQTRSAP